MKLINAITVSSKGQLVIPASLRRKLGMASGSTVEIIEESDGIKLRVISSIATQNVANLAGIIKAPSKGKPRSLANFDAASLQARQAPAKR